MASLFNFTTNGSLYVYSATYTIAGWGGSDANGYTQTVTATPENTNSPAIDSKSQLGPPMTKATGVKATDKALMKTLSTINSGYSSTNDGGTVTTKVWKKPTTDIKIYWYGNPTKGEEVSANG